MGFTFRCENSETFVCIANMLSKEEKISITFNPFGGLKHLLCGVHSNDGFIDLFFATICCSSTLR